MKSTRLTESISFSAFIVRARSSKKLVFYESPTSAGAGAVRTPRRVLISWGRTRAAPSKPGQRTHASLPHGLQLLGVVSQRRKNERRHLRCVDPAGNLLPREPRIRRKARDVPVIVGEAAVLLDTAARRVDDPVARLHDDVGRGRVAALGCPDAEAGGGNGGTGVDGLDLEGRACGGELGGGGGHVSGAVEVDEGDVVGLENDVSVSLYGRLKGRGGRRGCVWGRKCVEDVP